MVQALGVACGACHVLGNFAINQQFFPDHKPKAGESVLGRVTCYTCHQGEATPKLPPGAD